MSIPMKRAFGKKPAAVNIKRNFYTMASVDGDSAEITMYGDIVEEQPRDWWTDEPVEGQYIVESEFLEDLNAVAGCKKLTIRMKIVSEEYAIGQGELKNRTKHINTVAKDSAGSYEVTFGYRGNVIPLIHFDTKIDSSGRIATRVLRSNARQLLDHAKGN